MGRHTKIVPRKFLTQDLYEEEDYKEIRKEYDHSLSYRESRLYGSYAYGDPQRLPDLEEDIAIDVDCLNGWWEALCGRAFDAGELGHENIGPAILRRDQTKGGVCDPIHGR